jgi:hypothetical protein
MEPDESFLNEGVEKMNRRNPSAADIFPDEFIRKHTDFETSEEFIAACEELMGEVFSEIDGVDEKFVAFIREHTDFDDFAGMFTKAAGEWVVSCFGM